MFIPVQHDPNRSSRFPGSHSTGSSQGIYLCLYLSSIILTGQPDYQSMFITVQHNPGNPVRSARFTGSRSTGSSQNIYLCFYLSSMILTGLPDFFVSPSTSTSQGMSLCFYLSNIILVILTGLPDFLAAVAPRVPIYVSTCPT